MAILRCKMKDAIFVETNSCLLDEGILTKEDMHKNIVMDREMDDLSI